MKSKLKILKKEHKTKESKGYMLDYFSIRQYDNFERYRKRFFKKIDEDKWWTDHKIDCTYGDFSTYDREGNIWCEFSFCDLPLYIDLKTRFSNIELTLTHSKDSKFVYFEETSCRGSKFRYNIIPLSGITSFGGQIFVTGWRKYITVYTYEVKKIECLGCDDCYKGICKLKDKIKGLFSKELCFNGKPK